MVEHFGDRLSQRIAALGPICAGVDPRPERLPAGQGAAAWGVELGALLGAEVAAIKPQLAFFGDDWAAAEGVARAANPGGALVIADCKRGDIGSTAEAYAEGHFRLADSLTLHPYLGHDSIAPFLKWCPPEQGGRGVFVLVRTSNPGAKDLQDLRIGDEPLCDIVARAVTEWSRGLPTAHGYGPVGAVVGATWPEELQRLRKLLPQSWLLLPGVGAQGGKVQDLAAAFDERGLGALVNQSRGVMQCFAPSNDDWLDRIEQACRDFAADCRAVAVPTTNS